MIVPIWPTGFPNRSGIHVDMAWFH